MAWLSGCCMAQKATTPLHEVDSQYKAGSTNVAVTYVEPWDTVASTLKPDFNISGEAALSKVIPQTTTALNRVLNAMSGSLDIGLSGTTTASGVAPTTNQITSAGNAKDVGSADVTGKDIVQEPVLQYTAALALFQEVQLLNRYVLGAPSRLGYVPYLVRLQVTLIPYARNEPYDSYSNISFFVKHNIEELNKLIHDGKQIEQPFVIPLVATDSLEGTLMSTTNETVRQFALALGGVVQNAQAKTELQKLADELRSSKGTDLNSLQTIGRSNDNSIQVRLGAKRSPIGDGAYVMVPSTHNITLLLLAPKGEVSSDIPQAIKVTSRTQFRHTTTGDLLEAITLDEYVSSMRDISRFYLKPDSLNSSPYFDLNLKTEPQVPVVALNCSNPNLTLPGNTDGVEKNKAKLLTHLLSLTGDNDYQCFVNEAKFYFASLDNHMYLWNDLSILANTYGFAGTSFELPKPPVDPGFKFETAVTTIPVKTDNTSQISVYLNFTKDNVIEISAKGGEIKSAAFPDNKGAPGNSIPVTGGVVTTTGKAGSRMEIILNINNVLSGGTLKLLASGNQAGKKSDATPLNITLK